MEFNLKNIENKLSELTSHEERVNYLNERLFSLTKKLAEFEAFHLSKLEILKEITKQDFIKYHLEFLNGRLVYWYEEKSKYEYVNKLTAERLKLENYKLLKERLSLENKFNDIKGQITLFEGLIEKIRTNTKIIGKKIDADQPVPDSQNGLTAAQTALIAVFKGEIITRKKHGNSLYTKFSFYSNRDNRVKEMKSPTAKKFHNRIKLLQSIVTYLHPSAQETVKSEIKLNETLLENGGYQ